ncbi:hypothetical protein [Streptomyces fumanus]|uniref:hypothetical protein n=1 Tax=Streptomyces fumanus TaxID=67302 RepID=UPI0033E48445
MTYTVGEKVKYAKMRDAAEILSGPHASQNGTDRYLIKKADGNVSLVKVTELTAVDSRLDLVAETLHRALYGCGLRSKTSYSGRKMYVIADAVLYALDKDAPIKKGPLKKGDRIRITETGHNGASVDRGDILIVQDPDFHGDGSVFTTNAPKATSYSAKVWYFTHHSEGNGWERV